MKNKNKIEKGNYGYINKNKLKQLGMTLLLLAIVLIIFYTGIIRYHHTKSIFTVLAAVSAIPAAKYGVAYLVMFPYKTGDAEKYKKISAYKNVKILSDLLISSPEKIYNIELAAVRDNSVYCYSPIDKYDNVVIEKYVRSFLETECKVSAVKVFKDFIQFKKSVEILDKNEQGKYDKRIGELMTVYSM